MTAVLVVAFVALLLLAAGFSALETAMSVQRESMPGAGLPTAVPKGGRAMVTMPFIHEALLFGAAANLALAAVGMRFLLGPMMTWGWNPWWNALVMFGGGMIAVEVLPRFIALRHPRLALRVMMPVLMMARRIFGPVVSILTRTADGIVRIITPARLKPLRGMLIEEVETLIEMREELGAISPGDAEVLQEIVNLHAHTVKDCMTPRVDLPLMPDDADDDEAVQMLETSRFRHVLVFDERADTIKSVLDAEAWRLLRPRNWRTMMRQPVFVPETMYCLDALRGHLPDAASAVVIVDEYGGFEGMMTRRNIVERLLAKAAPTSASETTIQSLGEGRHVINGMTRVDEVCRELDVSLEAEGIDTIGGLVFNRFGYLPKPGEKIMIDGIEFKVKRTGRNRIQQLEILQPSGGPGEAS